MRKELYFIFDMLRIDITSHTFDGPGSRGINHPFCRLAMTFSSTFLKIEAKSKAPRIRCFVGLKLDIFDVIKNVMCTSEFTLEY